MVFEGYWEWSGSTDYGILYDSKLMNNHYGSHFKTGITNQGRS